MTNDQMTAGPAMGTASDNTKKMPVPMVAPTPNIDSWKSPIERESSLLPVSLPVSSSISTTGLRRNSCWLSEDMSASHRYHLVALTQGSDNRSPATKSAGARDNSRRP